jgi:hypothetical protein
MRLRLIVLFIAAMVALPLATLILPTALDERSACVRADAWVGRIRPTFRVSMRTSSRFRCHTESASTLT